MQTHISRVSNCFSALRQLRGIRTRMSVSQPVLLSLVTSLILTRVTRLDYRSANLSGVPGHLLNRLQSVLNAVIYSCAACLSRAEVRPRHSSASWLVLVAGFGENILPTGRACLPLSSQHGASVYTSPVTCAGSTRKKSYSVYVPTLANDWSYRERNFARLATVHSVHVTATRARNSLHPTVTSAPSFTMFKRQLKTFSFDNSFSCLYIFNVPCQKLFCLSR